MQETAWQTKIITERIRPMSQKIYLGIDLAKGTSKVATIDEDGNEIFSPFSITNSKKGVEKLVFKQFHVNLLR